MKPVLDKDETLALRVHTIADGLRESYARDLLAALGAAKLPLPPGERIRIAYTIVIGADGDPTDQGIGPVDIQTCTRVGDRWVPEGCPDAAAL